MNNFFQRILTGVVFVVLLLLSIYFSPYTFLFLFVAVTGLSMYEFCKIVLKNTDRGLFVSSVVCAKILFVTAFLQMQQPFKFPFLTIYVFCFILVLIAQLFRKNVQPIKNWAIFISGQFMVVFPFASLNGILFSSGWQPALLIAMFLTIWMNDSWAYVFGVTLGRHKMFERVSPKKSWEGFAGGALMSLLTGYLCWRFLPMLSPTLEMSLWQWLVFAEIVVVFGTLGDLMESLFKRTYEIKDSSNLIPGHGGFLDRFDSTMLAAPAIYLFLELLSYWG